MLIDFSVKNYHSYKNWVSLYGSPGRSRKNEDHIINDETLKVSAIFGPNASGKSNIITAIKTMKNIITNEYCTFKYPLYNWSSDSSVSEFVIHFNSNNRYFKYYLAIDSKCFNDEATGRQFFMPLVVNERLDYAYDINPMTGEENWIEVLDTGADPEFIESNFKTLIGMAGSLVNEELVRTKVMKNNSKIRKSLSEKERIDQLYEEAKGVENSNLEEIRKERKKILDDVLKYRKKGEELVGELNDTYYALKENRNNLDLARPLVSTNRFDEKYVKIDKQKFSEIASEVLKWFTSSLKILETTDYLLPIGQNQSMNGLTTVIKSLDVGISGLEWKHMTNRYGDIDDIKYKMDETEYLRLDDCRNLSIKYSNYVATTIKQDGVFYLFSYWMGEEKVYFLSIKHDGGLRSLDTSYESDGTMRIIELAAILLPSNDDKIFIVDELDRRLHPNLTKQIVSQFINDDCQNKQLIFTTHETNLMTTNLFRLDEIWVVDKDDNGESTIKSLDELNIKHDELLVEQYLSEKIGGTPSIER